MAGSEGEASTVGCLLIVGSVGGCVAVFLALSQQEPKWFWGLPIAGLLLWLVYSIHKDALGPKNDLETQIARSRFENIKLSETNQNLQQALSGYKQHEATEEKLSGYYSREREKLNELKRTLDAQIEGLRNEGIKLEDDVEKLRCQEVEMAQEKMALHTMKVRSAAEMEEFWMQTWEERSAGFPSMAEMAADAWLASWKLDIQKLLPRAPTTALELSQKLSKELRNLKARAAIDRNMVAYYESLFPWIEEFREDPPPDDTNEVDTSAGERPNWVDKDEWKGLDDTQRSQLALEKFLARNKSKWEIGIEYERWCGWMLEKEGWNVTYNGAIRGFDDLGRDIIARKPATNEILIVQCKRWSAKKEIHEKHVFQTFGTTVAMRIDEPTQTIKGVISTTTRMSDRARDFAKILGVVVMENKQPTEFPRIKCNANSKIYHLPFDQKYDEIVMGPNSKSFYVMTASEAVSERYRRAKRWMG